VDRTVLSFMSS